MGKCCARIKQCAKGVRPRFPIDKNGVKWWVLVGMMLFDYTEVSDLT